MDMDKEIKYLNERISESIESLKHYKIEIKYLNETLESTTGNADDLLSELKHKKEKFNEVLKEFNKLANEVILLLK